MPSMSPIQVIASEIGEDEAVRLFEKNSSLQSAQSFYDLGASLAESEMSRIKKEAFIGPAATFAKSVGKKGLKGLKSMLGKAKPKAKKSLQWMKDNPQTSVLSGSILGAGYMAGD